jgi:hypothetical protein
LKIGKPVTVFELDNKGWGKITRKKNVLSICISKQDGSPGEEDFNLDIVKIAVVYCSTVF